MSETAGAESATTTAQEQAGVDPHGAAEEALKRATTPPQALGGPAPESIYADGSDEPGPDRVGGEVQEPESQDPAHALAHRLAKTAADGGDVLVVEDSDSGVMQRAAQNVATAEDWDRATEFLLADQSDVLTRLYWVRVGGADDNPTTIPWMVKAIDINTIRSAEREASAGQAYDETKASLRIIVEGTVKPDVKELAKQKGLSDPTVLVARRFGYRPGVIAQVAGHVMNVSGFDPRDVKAAGNS